MGIVRGRERSGGRGSVVVRFFDFIIKGAIGRGGG